MKFTADPNAPNDLASIEKSVEHDYEINQEPNSASALKEAEAKNLDVVYPTSRQLQIDIDTDYQYTVFQKLQDLVNKYYGIERVEEHASRSGLPKRHITVSLYQDIGVMERIALQACLGSDRVRELLGVVQAKNNDPNPTLFLEAKSGSDLSKGKRPLPKDDIDDDIPF